MSKKIKGGFVAIPNILIDSEIWPILPGNALKIYVEACRRAWKRTDRFPLSHAKFKKQMAYQTFFKMRTKLLELGLIELVEGGGLFCNASLFKLSEKWKVYPSVKKNLERINENQEARKKIADRYKSWGGIAGGSSLE